MTKTTIYVGRWNDRDCVYALDADVAVTSVKEHFAFGDPSQDQYAVGNTWATPTNDSGWRILSMVVDAPSIEIEIKAGNEDETSHVCWTCPICGESYSDDWELQDCLPVLLMCGCTDKSKFFLGVAPENGKGTGGIS